MNKVFVVGDTHGSVDISKLNTRNFPEQKTLTKDDVLIQLGDFGNYWFAEESKEETYWLNWLAGKNYTFAFIDGNHDNHQKIWDLPTEERWDGIVHVDKRKTGEIVYLRRGEIYTINGKTILTIGGALSTDKHLRNAGIDWWETETLTKAQENRALDSIDEHNRVVDYVLTHTCPAHMVYHFTENKNRVHDPVAQFLEHVENLLEYKEWHFGHMHRDWVQKSEDGNHFQCHIEAPPYELP